MIDSPRHDVMQVGRALGGVDKAGEEEEEEESLLGLSVLRVCVEGGGAALALCACTSGGLQHEMHRRRGWLARKEARGSLWGLTGRRCSSSGESLCLLLLLLFSFLLFLLQIIFLLLPPFSISWEQDSLAGPDPLPREGWVGGTQ